MNPLKSSSAPPGRAPNRRGHADLELVVPAFNEAARLPATLAEVTGFLSAKPWHTRVVVVDNGSTDDTAAIVDARGWDVEVVVVGCSRPGKGAAVRRGIAGSTARLVGFIDADLSTPVPTLNQAIAELEAGATAAIASRHAPGAELTHPQPLLRRLGGSVFRLLARRLVPGIHDTQCGFKIFDRVAVQQALHRCQVNGFAFDVELLRQLRRAGGRIAEIPVTWTDDARSTFRPLRDGRAAFTDLLRLYRADRLGTSQAGAR
ncbi:glycosyltransferase [Catellatospora citrea]|uniref:Glycosyl transferase n=1 Tax=Catellatospora citrea TaxID=53366 RepID=A0A8J3KK49_9ACTN|nr:glycosyltransferase [Catellatospora citrea]RKE11159.1 glycosyltransferase involved in cell wall biosynthesis [Catellatospora citrea]GIF96624.1 glycosyl transferase [Catellatospora citrea]